MLQKKKIFISKHFSKKYVIKNKSIQINNYKFPLNIYPKISKDKEY